MDRIYSDNNGVLRLVDGTVIAIVEIKYSPNSATGPWESKFNPYVHIAESGDGTTIEGHKWMKVRHAGDINFQAPMYINAEDGKTPEFRINSGYIQWGFADVADSWQDLIEIDSLKGEQGDQGPAGKGLEPTTTGYYGEFINSRPAPTSGCTSCNGSTTTTTGVYSVLSLGDGNHVITADDQSNSKFRSDDGITWIAIGLNDVGRTTRFIADDGLGTNYIDYRLTNTEYSSKGKLYVFNFATNNWVVLDGVTASTPQVAPSAAKEDQAGFMDSYESATIGLDANDDLEVKDDSVDAVKLKAGTFTHGLDETGTDVKVNPSDIAGYGLSTYTSDTTSEKKLQVLITELLSNGVTADSKADADGETAYTVMVNLADLINAFSGLETVVQGDGYLDLQVKAGDAIGVDGNGVNVKGDEVTIKASGLSSLILAPTDNNSKGVQAKHLHSNGVNENKGLKKGVGETAPYEIKLGDGSVKFGNDGGVEISASKAAELLAGYFAYVNHQHTTSQIIGLDDFLNAFVKADTYYDGEAMLFDSQYGPLWKSGSVWKKLTLDENGNTTFITVNPSTGEEVGLPTPINVQADWLETTPSDPAYIKNKPEIIPQEQADWGEIDTESKAFINNKPVITNPVQSDWTETATGSLAYIANKPVLPLDEVWVGDGTVATPSLNKADFKTWLDLSTSSEGANVAKVAATGGDFTTVKAAVDAGYRMILLDGAVTETEAIEVNGDFLIVRGLAFDAVWTVVSLRANTLNLYRLEINTSGVISSNYGVIDLCEVTITDSFLNNESSTDTTAWRIVNSTINLIGTASLGNFAYYSSTITTPVTPSDTLDILGAAYGCNFSGNMVVRVNASGAALRDSVLQSPVVINNAGSTVDNCTIYSDVTISGGTVSYLTNSYVSGLVTVTADNVLISGNHLTQAITNTAPTPASVIESNNFIIP